MKDEHLQVCLEEAARGCQQLARNLLSAKLPPGPFDVAVYVTGRTIANVALASLVDCVHESGADDLEAAEIIEEAEQIAMELSEVLISKAHARRQARRSKVAN